MNLRMTSFVKFFVLFGLMISLFSCGDEFSEIGNELIIQSDFEKVDGEFFVAGNSELKGSASQSITHARSGKYSAELNHSNEFGFSYTFEDVKKGDVIVFSAWRMSTDNIGSLVIKDQSKEGQYVSTGRVQYFENDWGFVEAYFLAEKDCETVQLYGHNPNEKSAYFDDVTIKYYSNNTVPDDSFEALELKMDEGVFNQISQFRDEALSQGMIQKGQKEYVNASILMDGEEIPVELRLKGDWTDHLETDKWSFRIKVKGDHAYKGLKSFSIQNPSTRSFMNEWFAHKLFEKEEVLTTRYMFVPVIVNGVKKGVYALEEHFDKQLLESRNRREAPIVKFDESGIWEHHKYDIDDSVNYAVPILFSADISVFKNNRTYKSPVLKNLFRIAQSQMDRYRSHDPELNEYMDLESYAKFIALSDVLNGKHGLIWHNQRFYINPLTNKLEPIAYDCFTERELMEYDVLIEGLGRSKRKRYNLVQAALSNPELENLYTKYLKKFSEKQYLNSVFDELHGEIENLENMLQFEDPSVELNRGFFERNCVAIQKQLIEYEKFQENPTYEIENNVNYAVLDDNFLYTEIALKAYTISKGDEGMQVRLRNYHRNKITVIGFGVKGIKDSIIKCPSVNLNRYSDHFSEAKMKFNQKIKRVFYTAENCGDRIFSVKVNKWDAPGDIRFVQEQIPEIISKNQRGEFVLSSGRYVLNDDLIIPAGTRFIIEKGVELDVKNGAAIISRSPVSFNGTKTERIHLYSSDSSANGVTIIAPNTKSQMTFTRFEGFKSLTKDFWSLTGAVAIYKSSVTLDHCSFEKNHCEDGLNLIQCDFRMTNCSVSETTSDGFDADFCTGVVNGCTFSNTGNDCIDFSGSQIEIEACNIVNAGDKGISGGENSNLTVKNCNVNGAYIAIASKDLSEVTVSNLSIEKSQYGFAAYRKKPEYGPAKVIVESVKKNNAQELHLLEKNSELLYLGKSYVGDKMFNIDSMYMMYSK